MMETHIINILTRTSNRPNGFEKCYNSIHTQSYKNINHIVSCDNKMDYELYLCKYENIDIVYIDREKLIKEDKCVNPNTGKYSPHNLYFNEMYCRIKEGWVMFLDDDDNIIGRDTIQEIVDKVKEVNEDTIIYWKMVFPNGFSIPKKIDENTPPILGNIGGVCVLFNKKYLDYATWDSWKCGDFRLIDKLDKKINNRVFLNKNMININHIGSGNKIDLK